MSDGKPGLAAPAPPPSFPHHQMNDSLPDDARLLRLNAADNVLTVIASLGKGGRIVIDGEPIETTRAFSLGDKIASRPIGAGEKIVKYGAPIGSATQAIARGEHVHTHNLKSDYLPTLLRGEMP